MRKPDSRDLIAAAFFTIVLAGCIFLVRSLNRQDSFNVSKATFATDHGHRICIYGKHGEEIAFMAKDSNWTIYDCRRTVETLVERLNKK